MPVYTGMTLAKGYTAGRQRRRKRELHLSILDNLARWHFAEGLGNDRMSRQATASASLALVFVMATACGNGAAAGPIEDLPGYWTGAGTVLLTNGSTERVKCAVIYKVGGSGTQIKQTMRCASADYNINAAAELRVNGAQVSGNWEEKTYSATGDVAGRYTGSSFVLSIKGQNFTAGMNVGLSSCKQSINITPQGLDVRRISMNLAKC